VTTDHDRDLDIVVVGATGFTGALTAEYLAAHGPKDLKWGIAGRSRARLDALRERLGGDVAVLVAEVDDPASLRAVAGAARVVVTTVGPYLRYGDPLVAACAEAGTDYVDLCGEPEFVDRTYLRHHETAVRSGARIVHACGFDSIPTDLGVLYTVQQLPADRPIRVRGYLSASGLPSGGTFASAVNAFGRFRQQARAAADRRRIQGGSGPRRIRSGVGTAGFDRAVNAWVLPLPVLDPQVVEASARALDRYGPDFSYRHHAAVENPLVAGALAAGAVGMAALAQVPPARQAMLRLRPAGAGPSPERRDRSWFRARFVADCGDRRVVTEVSGGDPGYGETSKMLAESAMCLAGDPLPQTAGQVTTAVAMGDALRDRLEKAGIAFRLLS
jgi:short subunit dehydrogenase-like uncharacterized protein